MGDNLAIERIENLGQHITQETVVGSLLLVETENEFSIVVLLHLVHNTMRKVSRKAHLGEQRNIDRCSNIGSVVEHLCALLLALLVLVEHNSDGRKRYMAVLLAHKQCQVHTTSSLQSRFGLQAVFGVGTE